MANKKKASRGTKKEVKAVIFDLGGVIMSGGYLAFLHHYCLKCLTPLGKKKIDDLEHQVNLGKITEPQFYRAIRQVFNIHLTPKQMHNTIVNKMRVNKALVKFIPHIKKAKVVLFTNSIGHMAIDVLHKRGVPIRKTFDKLFVSSKIHLAKPDAKAYRYVVKNLKINPGQALMVDDRQENISAAKEIGMQGIVFKNTSQFKKALAKYKFYGK